ncbi:MAG: ABC transporter permease [Betaproteobacteria bacterium]|nr:ABC transporter permease [Betaproteobacteria bacterium]
MPFLPVFLPTDVLFWFLIAGVAGYAAYCLRRPHLALPWRRVFRSGVALACAVILAVFTLAALLDSVHFRPRLPAEGSGGPAYSAEVLSLLDLALSGIRGKNERTYSAPLATRLYAKEVVEVREGPDAGKQVREYPRLRYGGAHLASEQDWVGDVFARVGAGLVAACVAAALLGLAVRRLRRRAPDVPWKAGGAALLALLVLALPIAFLAPYYHVLGTDKVGQDVLYLALKSVRVSLIIGTLTTLVLLPIAIALGLMAGYFRGWVDDAIQYVYTTLNSIPGVLLIAAFVLMLQVFLERHSEWFYTAAERADARLLVLCVVLGITSWTGLARLLRGEALKLSQLDFVQAAHAFGVPDRRILSRHLLPNVAHIVIISVVMDFSGLVLAEAVLSYVGVGVDPATTSFGTMINAARLEMGREPIVWWSLAAAFVFMFVLVLAANLFADAVRDGFDPRVRVGGAPA